MCGLQIWVLNLAVVGFSPGIWGEVMESLPWSVPCGFSLLFSSSSFRVLKFLAILKWCSYLTWTKGSLSLFFMRKDSLPYTVKETFLCLFLIMYYFVCALRKSEQDFQEFCSHHVVNRIEFRLSALAASSCSRGHLDGVIQAHFTCQVHFWSRFCTEGQHATLLYQQHPPVPIFLVLMSAWPFKTFGVSFVEILRSFSLFLWKTILEF